jgi:hypothetical protein
VNTGTMSIDRPQIPTEDRKPALRAACLAYREKRREGASDHEAHEAAVAAVQAVWKQAPKPLMPSPTRAVITPNGYGAVCRRKAVLLAICPMERCRVQFAIGARRSHQGECGKA